MESENFYHTLSNNELLLQQDAVNDKILKAKDSQYAVMLDTLYRYREMIDQEVNSRIEQGLIAETTFFEIDEYFRKKNDIETAMEELKRDAQFRWQADELNDDELELELEKIKENYEREINALDKAIKSSN